jgi:hypothetical protein
LVAVVVRVGEYFWTVCKPIVNRRYLQLVGKISSGFVYLRERERERERESERERERERERVRERERERERE